MMAEGQVRELLAVLKGNLQAEQNLVRSVAFSGGVSALEMVLEDGPATARVPNPLEAELNRGLAADKAEEPIGAQVYRGTERIK